MPATKYKTAHRLASWRKTQNRKVGGASVLMHHYPARTRAHFGVQRGTRKKRAREWDMRIYGSRLEFVYSCRAAEQFIVILTYAPFYRAKIKQAGEIQQHQGLYIPSFSYLENSAKSSDTQHHSQSGHYRFRYKNIGALQPVKPDKNLANPENAHVQRVLHRPAFVICFLCE